MVKLIFTCDRCKKEQVTYASIPDGWQLIYTRTNNEVKKEHLCPVCYAATYYVCC